MNEKAVSFLRAISWVLIRWERNLCNEDKINGLTSTKKSKYAKTHISHKPNPHQHPLFVILPNYITFVRSREFSIKKPWAIV